MQAVVLVGGEGTRLRPLTLTHPKPALSLVDRPFIRYMVDWLGRHGIDEVCRTGKGGIFLQHFYGENAMTELNDRELTGARFTLLRKEDLPFRRKNPVSGRFRAWRIPT